MEELNDMENRLEVLSNVGNASYSHERTAILKKEIDFLREGNKKKKHCHTKPTRERKSTPSKQE